MQSFIGFINSLYKMAPMPEAGPAGEQVYHAPVLTDIGLENAQTDRTLDTPETISNVQNVAVANLQLKRQSIKESLVVAPPRIKHVSFLSLNRDTLIEIFSASKTSVSVAGRYLSICKHFLNVLDNDNFWKLLARANNIILHKTFSFYEEGNLVHRDMTPKMELGKRILKLKNVLAKIEIGYFERGITAFDARTQAQIEREGAICLVPNDISNADNIKKTSDKEFYRGMVITKGPVKDKLKWVFHVVPGINYNGFKEADFNRLMPVAINKLCELEIEPEYLSNYWGSFTTQTYNNFHKWQQKNSSFVENFKIRREILKTTNMTNAGKTHLGNEIKNAIITLKQPSYLDYLICKNLHFQTQAQIERNGGICLIPNVYTRYTEQITDSTPYEGLVVTQEQVCGMDLWYLHIIPGIRQQDFTVEDFEIIMPMALNKLSELKIMPAFVMRDCYYSEISLRNFEQWQKNQSK